MHAALLQALTDDQVRALSWTDWGSLLLQRAVIVVLTGFLVWAVPKGIALWEKWTQTKVTSEQALAAVAYAEEQASKFAKGIIPVGPETPAEKLDTARKYLRDMVPDVFEKLKPTELDKVIESAVNVYRNLKGKSDTPTSVRVAVP